MNSAANPRQLDLLMNLGSATAELLQLHVLSTQRPLTRAERRRWNSEADKAQAIVQHMHDSCYYLPRIGMSD